MSLSKKDLEALRLLAKSPDGLAESNVTSEEHGTIYHATAKRLLEADANDGFGDWIFFAGRDRYTRPVYKITDEGRDVVAAMEAEEAPTPMKTLTPDEELERLVYVWELIPNGHEIFHRGTYRLLEEIQPKEGEATPTVYLRLHGPVREHEHRTIDKATGAVDVHRFTTRTGPVLIRPTSAIVRARIRTDEAPTPTLTITDREITS